MLEPFDWVRLARGGAELMTTLRFIQNKALNTQNLPLAGPHSALHGPCLRCGLYSRRSHRTLCMPCSQIMKETPNFIQASKDSLILWGQTDGVPLPLRHPGQQVKRSLFGPAYFRPSAFLLGLKSFSLIAFLREIVFAHGHDLSGHFLIFPTMSTKTPMNMSDVLITAMRQRLTIIPGQLNITLMPSMYWAMNQRKMGEGYENTASIQNFIALLDMAQNFRHFFSPQEQEHIKTILKISSFQEKMFHWNRFVGLQEESAQEYLSVINLINWPSWQCAYFFQILPYVSFYITN